MTSKSLPVIIVLIAIGVMFASLMAFVASAPRPSKYHEEIIKNTAIKAVITNELTVKLEARCIDATSRTVNALSITDIARRGLWLDHEVPFSLWSFEYKGHPLGYVQIWGPHQGYFYVLFSKATMTTIDIDVMGETATFPLSPENPPQNGLWWTWIETE